MSIRSVGKKRLARLALAGAILALFPGPLIAAPPAEPSRAQLEERIRRLEQIIEKHGLDKPTAAPPAAKPPALEQSEVEQIVDDKLRKQKVLAGWKDGFFLESPSGDFKLKLRGYLQADARVPFGDEKQELQVPGELLTHPIQPRHRDQRRALQRCRLVPGAVPDVVLSRFTHACRRSPSPGGRRHAPGAAACLTSPARVEQSLGG